MKFRVNPWFESVFTNVWISSGVISRSPVSLVSVKGFGKVSENGCSVAGSVLAHVRSKFGSVTIRRAEAL
jgi:hypothetical protein